MVLKPINGNLRAFLLTEAQLMETQFRTVGTCIVKYADPGNKFCDKIAWVAYRIWNAIKAIFGVSDWQKATAIVKESAVQSLKAKLYPNSERLLPEGNKMIESESNKFAFEILCRALAAQNNPSLSDSFILPSELKLSSIATKISQNSNLFSKKEDLDSLDKSAKVQEKMIISRDITFISSLDKLPSALKQMHNDLSVEIRNNNVEIGEMHQEYGIDGLGVNVIVNMERDVHSDVPKGVTVCGGKFCRDRVKVTVSPSNEEIEQAVASHFKNQIFPAWGIGPEFPLFDEVVINDKKILIRLEGNTRRYALA